MSLEDRSRRLFLKSSGALAGTSYLRVLAPAAAAIAQAAGSARAEAAPFAVLGDAEARDLAAIAARILPTTDTPGANEAGVIYFIDRAFAKEMSDQFESARGGLGKFADAVEESHPGKRFDELDEDAQDAFLATREDTPFFQLMWTLTIFGFFAMPKYGGNRDKVGWELIGFEGDHGPWQYPFGYYDAEVHRETNDGE